MIQSYPSIVSGEPLYRSNFDVYLQDRTLYYVREHCDSTDVDAPFFLRFVYIVPSEDDDLSSGSRRYVFDNLEFSLVDHGGLFGRKCMVSVDLLQYEIVQIGTGQIVEGQ